jgi:hypothetical protein
METLLSVVAVLAVLAAIGVGLRFLLPVILEHVKGSFGNASGWGTLSRIYATSNH